MNTGLDTIASNPEPQRKSDLIAGFLVALIALPLSLGIAMASGFPPMAGVLSAIVGGLIVSRLNGSHLTITGPAAGLTVVILDAVQSLGDGDPTTGYRATLAAIVISGILQTGLGALRAGRYAAIFPGTIVHGMLAAIGLIIMGKQIHVLFGMRPDNSLLDAVSNIPNSLTYFPPTIGLIALFSLTILIVWPHLTISPLRRIPAPLAVIVVGIVLGKLFGLAHFRPAMDFQTHEPLRYLDTFLLTLPEDITDVIVFPDFSQIGRAVFWQSVVAISLVGSLETLLSAAAVDRLDPQRRQSDLNRELISIGIGNTIAGMIGGLPMISEIVRSSANVDYGAKSGWANFYHGGFLLLFVLVAPAILALTPLASLAAILVVIGYRLASPASFLRTLDIGVEQFVLFILTVIAILMSNLLVGVFLGVVAKFTLHLIRGVNFRDLWKLSYRIESHSDSACTVHIYGAAVFSNFLGLKAELAAFPVAKSVSFDLTNADMIDHTVMDFIESFRKDMVANGGQCEVIGLAHHETFGAHTLSSRRRKRVR